MSHKQQTELKRTIQSQKQRMEREQEIRVPYHKPKQYSLKEFLARRTLQKTQMEKTNEPVSTIMSIKMASSNIEEFVHKMKEREEEAIEFFRSESESDEDEESRDNQESVSMNAIVGTSDSSNIADDASKAEQTVEANSELKEDRFELKTIETSENLPDAFEENRVDEIIDSKEQKALISKTDIKLGDVEMYRLHEKYKNVSEMNEIETEKQDLGAILGTVLTLKTLDEMHSRDSIIDLETGQIQLSGPEMLFQRYLKTVQKPKQKDSVCLNILSFENGKFENQKVEVKLNKKEEMDHNRPGFSHELFKETLRSKIIQKRLEDIRMRNINVEPTKPDEASNCKEEKNIGNEEEEDESENEEELPERKKNSGATDSCAFLDEEVKNINFWIFFSKDLIFRLLTRKSLAMTQRAKTHQMKIQKK